MFKALTDTSLFVTAVMFINRDLYPLVQIRLMFIDPVNFSIYMLPTAYRLILLPSSKSVLSGYSAFRCLRLLMYNQPLL